MATSSLDNETVNLVPGVLTMSQPVDMSIFRLTDWKLDYKWVGEEKQGISMVVVMKRKITSEMMTTYFPSLLLMMITYATTFFKPFFFDSALGVNLTTMLVMTTIFISKLEGLPPTSDIKMIDVWLVLCQMVPFAEVLLLLLFPYILHRSEKHHLCKGHQLTEDQPIVDHLSGRGWGQALHLADEDGGHHQHGRQVNAQCCLEEEGLEEGCGECDCQE